MKHVTIGTAGHVDHGKTALVKALTGVDTDRVEEEKARGISIVLGFTHLELPGGTVDLVDVPGHERFIKTMISGATGLGAVLLVVAADEGVMPQTVEHLEIATLLGVKRGVVVVTKSDLVAQAERRLVVDDIRVLAAATFLADAPVVFTSVRSGEGLEDLKAHLNDLLLGSAVPEARPNVYLPIDRVFTASGFGTVVTGTLRRGQIRVGETLELTPGGLRAEVRGLQVHGQQVALVQTGWRAAVNLRGLKKDRLSVGDALITPEYLVPTRLYDAELRLLKSAPKPLKNAERVRLSYGTTEVFARVRLLDAQVLTPGATSGVQLRFDKEVAAPFREPFVLRGASPVRTLGGGLLLAPQARKHRRFDTKSSGYVRALARGSLQDVVKERLTAAGIQGYELAALRRELELTSESLKRELGGLPLLVIGGHRIFFARTYEELMAQTLEKVADFHAEQPTRYGISKEALRARLPKTLPAVIFSNLLAQLTREGRLEAQQSLLKLVTHDSAGKLSPQQEKLADELEVAFRSALFHPPELTDVLAGDALRLELYHVLVRRGRLIPTKDKDATIVFHHEAISTVRHLLAERFSNAPFTLSEARALLATSRKYLLPLLDYLDSTGYTQREGNERFIGGELPLDSHLI